MWLPRPIYEALPYAYMAAGAVLLAAAYLAKVGPRGLLLAGGAVAATLGLVLWMRRRDYRSTHRQ
jgi:Flp pilus assembly protein TadB